MTFDCETLIRDTDDATLGRYRKRDDAHARGVGSVASPEPSYWQARRAAVYQGRPYGIRG